MKKILSRFAVVGVIAAILGLFAPNSFGATFTNASAGGTSGYPINGAGKVFLMKATLNMTNFALASNDVVQLFNIPSNSLVYAVLARPTTVTTNAFQFDVGDGTDTDGWIVDGFGTNTYQVGSTLGTYSSFLVVTNQAVSTLSLTNHAAAGTVVTGIVNQTTTVYTPASGSAYAAGKLYTAADTIDARVDGPASTVGAIDFWCIVHKANSD